MHGGEGVYGDMTEDPHRDPLHDADWELLGRFIAGESDPAEVSRARAWIAARPGAAEALVSIQEVADDVLLGDRSDIDVEAALARVTVQRVALDARPSNATEQPRARVLEFRRRPSRREYLANALKIAAAVVAIAGVGTVLQRTYGSSAPATFATRVGESRRISLADGSSLVLGPASRAVVASGYASGDRSVKLDGEAYFDVRHDAAHPFAVVTPQARINDVGTTFVVRADTAGSGSTRVVVVTGSVSVTTTKSAAPKPVVLTAGDAAVTDARGSTTAEPASGSADDIAWMQRRLVFKDASMGRVQEDVKRWYGVDLVIADSSLATRHLTASFADEPIAVVLRVIAATLGAEVDRDGNTATLRIAHASAHPVAMRQRGGAE